MKPPDVQTKLNTATVPRMGLRQLLRLANKDSDSCSVFWLGPVPEMVQGAVIVVKGGKEARFVAEKLRAMGVLTNKPVVDPKRLHISDRNCVPINREEAK